VAAVCDICLSVVTLCLNCNSSVARHYTHAHACWSTCRHFATSGFPLPLHAAVRLGKFLVSQPFRKLPSFCVTRMFISVFTRSLCGSELSSVQLHTYYYPPICTMVFQVACFLHGTVPKPSANYHLYLNNNVFRSCRVVSIYCSVLPDSLLLQNAAEVTFCNVQYAFFVGHFLRAFLSTRKDLIQGERRLS
jgi:hypothetical protein